MNETGDLEPWDELDELLANCVEDDHSAEERERLNEILRDNPRAQRRAVQSLFNESLVRGEIGFAGGDEIYGMRVRSDRPWWRKRVPQISAAAAAVALVSWAALTNLQNEEEKVSVAQAIPPIAEIVRVKGGELLGMDELAVASLEEGTYRMEEGNAELSFRNGVQAVIQGPIEFQVESDMRIILHSGRIRARVPSNATGFTVDTPEVDVVDLGTEFGVYVSKDRETQVHVFSGEVELHEEDRGAPRIVTEGFAANWSSRNGVTDFAEPDPEAFLTSEDLRREERRLLREELISSPDTFIYYDFSGENESPHILENRANPGSADGKILGPSWVQGRLPNNRALQFENHLDRVAVYAPGQFGQFTLSVWLKVDRLDSSITAIFNSDGYSGRNHHWQIIDSGAMRIAASQHFRFTSPDSLILPGQWVHLATTFDLKAMKSSCFVNGEMVMNRVLTSQEPIRFEQCNLGYWGQPLGWPKNRGFRGRMDEFFMQTRAMTPEEIARIYEVGKPSGW